MRDFIFCSIFFGMVLIKSPILPLETGTKQKFRAPNELEDIAKTNV
jgi:hypothetical protein